MRVGVGGLFLIEVCARQEEGLIVCMQGCWHALAVVLWWVDVSNSDAGLPSSLHRCTDAHGVQFSVAITQK